MSSCWRDGPRNDLIKVNFECFFVLVFCHVKLKWRFIKENFESNQSSQVAFTDIILDYQNILTFMKLLPWKKQKVFDLKHIAIYIFNFSVLSFQVGVHIFDPLSQFPPFFLSIYTISSPRLLLFWRSSHFVSKIQTTAAAVKKSDNLLLFALCQCVFPRLLSPIFREGKMEEKKKKKTWQNTDTQQLHFSVRHSRWIS